MKRKNWTIFAVASMIVLSLGCVNPLLKIEKPTAVPQAQKADFQIGPKARVWLDKNKDKENAVYYTGFGNINFSEEVAAGGSLVNPTDTFPVGTSKVWLFFHYSRVKPGAIWGWKVTRNGVNILKKIDMKWVFNEGSGDVAYAISANPELSGEYILTLYYESEETASGRFTISKTKISNIPGQVSNTAAPASTQTRAPTAPPTQALPKPTIHPNTPLALPAEMGGTEVPKKPSLPLGESYTDDRNLYSLKYPAGWWLSRTGGWQDICLDHEKYVCFHVQTRTIPKDSSLSAFMEDTYEIFKSTVGNYDLIKREEVYVGGYPAVLFEHGYTFKGSYNQGFAAYLVNPGKGVGYCIQAEIMEQMQDYDLYYETLKQMIYGFSVGE